jgi:hypothetical protein
MGIRISAGAKGLGVQTISLKSLSTKEISNDHLIFWPTLFQFAGL